MRNLTILITLLVLIALVVSIITYIKAPAPTSTPTPTSSPTATVTLPPRTTPTLSPTPALTPTFTPNPTQATLPQLKVHYIDVGQGDSILLDLGATEVLIDGGDGSLGVVSYLQQYVDGPLEAIVATHPHADHIFRDSQSQP
jgi:beta-lactamase superfamily II metal-dependent hydrolase